MVVLPDQCRQVLTELSARHLVCIISGRDLDDLVERTAVPGVYYAGDHGYRIIGPPGSNLEHEVGSAARDELAATAEYAREILAHVDGVIIEGKALSVSVHYRLVPPGSRAAVDEAISRIRHKFPELRQTGGKMVFEFHPARDWNKGAAMLWLLDHLGYDQRTACPVCVGDDETDENTFKASEGWGVSLIVAPVARPTHAGYMLCDTQETTAFLASLI
jgi:trehalose-phosphatase